MHPSNLRQITITPAPQDEALTTKHCWPNNHLPINQSLQTALSKRHQRLLLASTCNAPLRSTR
jgi:hypothetical protein